MSAADLASRRLNKGLSVLAAAKAIGVPPHVIRHAEKGGRPRPENALLIADFYGVTVTDLWPLPERSAA